MRALRMTSPLLLLSVGLVLMVPAACEPIPKPTPTPKPVPPRTDASTLPDGNYNVQSVSYDDASGTYRVFLLNPPAGHRPLFQASQVKMARLDDQALATGAKSRLTVENGEPVLLLTPDFQIAYTHNVTEERVNPQSGAKETVVVRQESSFWTPFMASMAGSMIANSLFTPMYVVPPAYSPGGLAGLGGQGATPQLANEAYRQKHGSLPPAARLSASGSTFKTGPAPAGALRPTGSGAGSSRLDTNPASKPRPKGKPFGSFRRR